MLHCHRLRPVNSSSEGSGWSVSHAENNIWILFLKLRILVRKMSRVPSSSEWVWGARSLIESVTGYNSVLAILLSSFLSHETEPYTSLGSHRLSIEWWHFQWPSRTLIPVFKVSAFLCRISKKKRCVLQSYDRKVIGKPCTVCEMVPFSMTLSDLVIFYLKGAAYKSTYLLTYLPLTRISTSRHFLKSNRQNGAY